jgi:hypothetical protein
MRSARFSQIVLAGFRCFIGVVPFRSRQLRDKAYMYIGFAGKILHDEHQEKSRDGKSEGDRCGGHYGIDIPQGMLYERISLIAFASR